MNKKGVGLNRKGLEDLKGTVDRYFLASPDALEVIVVTYSLIVLIARDPQK